MKYALIFQILCQSEWNYASQNRLTCCFQHQAKTKYSPVSCLLGKKIRVGRSEKDFIFHFIFILLLVDTLSDNDLSL